MILLVTSHLLTDFEDFFLSFIKTVHSGKQLVVFKVICYDFVKTAFDVISVLDTGKGVETRLN
jgi:hypothetical protein